MATQERELHLSYLDQTVLRMYVRHLIIFEFPHPNHAAAAIAALRSGFLATLHELPFLAGTLRSSDTDTAKLILTYPASITEESVDTIFNVNFDEAENLAYEFLDLERASFPPSRLPSDVFYPKSLIRHEGLDSDFAEGLVSFKKGFPIPVIAAQANFVMGGLILSIYSNHSATNGNGITAIYEKWSKHIQAYNESTIPGEPKCKTVPVSMTSLSELDRMRHALDHLANNTASATCPEVRSPGSAPRSNGLRDHPYTVAARILAFTETTISRLAVELSAHNAKRVSSFVTIVSILWTCITRIRASIIKEKGTENVKCSIAFDHRRNLGEEFVESYLGNCATAVVVAIPTSIILGGNESTATFGDGVAAVAYSVVETLGRVTLEWLATRLALFSATPNPHQLNLDIDIINGPDIFITSWMHQGADCEWSIPGTVSKTPQAIRKPRSRVESNIHILPRPKASNPARPYEVMVCLEQGELYRVTEALQKAGLVCGIIEA